MIERLTRNARRLGKQSQHLAAVLALCGVPAISLCCWCAELQESDGTEAIRLPKGGECARCPYAGRDALCVVFGESITKGPKS